MAKQPINQGDFIEVVNGRAVRGQLTVPTSALGAAFGSRKVKPRWIPRFVWRRVRRWCPAKCAMIEPGESFSTAIGVGRKTVRSG